MVGDDDQLVGGLHRRGHVLQVAEDRVQPLDGVHRLGPFGPGVVGDLVVVDEVHVDDWTPSAHLLGDDGEVQPPQQHVGHAAQKDVRAGARDPRFHATHSLAPALVQLLDHLAERQQQAAEEEERPGEERDVVSPRAESAGAHGLAHREVRLGGATGVGRAHRRPTVPQQPVAGSEPLLDQPGVGRLARREKAPLAAVPPPERRHLLVVAVEEPGHARRRRRRDRGPPAVQPVAGGEPPVEVRGLTGDQRPLDHLAGDPVELHDQEAAWPGGGRSAVDRAAPAAGHRRPDDVRGVGRRGEPLTQADDHGGHDEDDQHVEPARVRHSGHDDDDRDDGYLGDDPQHQRQDDAAACRHPPQQRVEQRVEREEHDDEDHRDEKPTTRGHPTDHEETEGHADGGHEQGPQGASRLGQERTAGYTVLGLAVAGRPTRVGQVRREVHHGDIPYQRGPAHTRTRHTGR